MVTNTVEQFRMGAWARGAIAFSVFVLASSAHVFGQWVTYPTRTCPGFAGGQPDLKALARGSQTAKPDFIGFWQPDACGIARRIWLHGCA